MICPCETALPTLEASLQVLTCVLGSTAPPTVAPLLVCRALHNVFREAFVQLYESC